MGARYFLISNDLLPENMTYYSQCWYDPTIPKLKLYESTELKYTIGEVIIPDYSHVRNQVDIDYSKMCVGN